MAEVSRLVGWDSAELSECKYTSNGFLCLRNTHRGCIEWLRLLLCSHVSLVSEYCVVKNKTRLMTGLKQRHGFSLCEEPEFCSDFLPFVQ